MVKDLLLSDKDRLKEWLRGRPYVKTSDVIRFGSENFSNRANRNKQELVQDGVLRRLPDDECILKFGVLTEDVYQCMEYGVKK